MWNLFGPRPALPAQPPDPVERIVTQHPLRRILSFTGRTIDDVVNNPIAKNEVYGYFKLQKQIARRSDVLDLERQWNPTGKS